jgi:hypothetical protein
MGKYFNVTVKPPIAVAALAAGNIAPTDYELFGQSQMLTQQLQ